ncbi:homeobox-leucine zipper protein HAT22-like [Abrus precatorius]|uniref:Homeobox-leucine zipper protein HAT22-like n=1 Tax=Abrus precatorius TaxID=3816 RepID=A0A8B8K3L5_ABRPR|nr:homeobox-leucine zipper protein HAT22-like [Abrus precatorius]
MEDDEACITSLSLGLGLEGYVPKKEKQNINKPLPCLDLTIELCPKGEAIEVDQQHHKAEGSILKDPNERSPENNNRYNGSRKKLKLTKEQSATLENNFKLHTTLNLVQKQALAEQLNLKHRQVEVWFQNRRARTKLKQTEVDCEFLKKCCKKLSEENQRLKKELQELRALKVGPSPLHIQLSKATTLTLCSSCEGLLKPNEGNKATVSDVVRNNHHKLQSSIELEGI